MLGRVPLARAFIAAAVLSVPLSLPVLVVATATPPPSPPPPMAGSGIDLQTELDAADEVQRLVAEQAEVARVEAERVRIEAEEARAKEAIQAQLAAVKPKVTVTYPAPVYAEPSEGIPAMLLAIRQCESGGNYVAQNPVSTASGAYQILTSTWTGWKVHVPEAIQYARAKDAPPPVQDLVAVLAFQRAGVTPWEASRRCWG